MSAPVTGPSTAIQEVPFRTPMYDSQRYMTRTWIMFFERISNQKFSILDTRANRLAKYPPDKFKVGTLFFETDTTVLYMLMTDGTKNWWGYVTGTMEGTLIPSTVPLTLTADDVGFQFFATDFNHLYRWDGAAWGWGEGEMGSGYIQSFMFAPSSTGWALCNGASVPYALPTTGTGVIGLPDLITTPSFAKWSGTVGMAPPVPPVIVPPLTTTGPSATVDVQAGTGATVADATHTHDILAIDFNPDGEPPAMNVLPYFRQ